MCLYERKLVNLKYLPTIKNGGKPKPLMDKTKLWINIGCGWCIECRTKIANEWKQRLNEEVKANPNGSYVTLSISPKHIKELEEEIIKTHYKGIDGNQVDINILANLAVRRFTERWRKKYKNAPRHWLVTEIGHRGSERLHLHGIIWRTKENITIEQLQEDINNIWQYGNVKQGDTLTLAVANYIIKYITKCDIDHKGYKPRTFVSKGIGEAYCIGEGRRRNQFRGDDTCTSYRWANGATSQICRYYKRKLYTDEEREFLADMQRAKNECWIDGVKYDLNQQDDNDFRITFQTALEVARTKNEKLGYGKGTTETRKYIVTDLMKMNYKDIKNYNKAKNNLIQYVMRRTKEKIYTANPDDWKSKELNKSIGAEHTKWGHYIGTTTEAERRRNAEIDEAKALGVTIQNLRLIKAGIITNL